MTIPTRPLGATGLDIPAFGLGTGEGGMGLRDRKAVKLYHHALDRGVTFFDTAPGYGTAHRQLARILKGRRDSLIVATKAPTPDGKKCTEMFEQSLRDLKTDYVDIAYVHSLGSHDVEETLSEHGSLAALVDLKKRGLARFIGFTAHNAAWKSARVLEMRDEIDVIMIALNYIESRTYGFEEQVLPVAQARKVGVIAMKVYGGAPDMEYKKPVPSALEARERADHEESFRYSLSLPGVSAAVIGCYTASEIDANLEYLSRFRPLTVNERKVLIAAGAQAAPRWGERYGPVK